MTKFSDTLAAWKTRVKYRIVNKKEPYSEIVKGNPTIMAEHFQIFKAACEAEAAKKNSKYMKGLQQRNIGSHHLGSRGYGEKRSKWAKEDAEAASLGIPDPLAEFTVPQERDVLRAWHRWDPVKKVFEMNAVTTEFTRLLVLLVSDQFDSTLVIFVNNPCAFCRESSTGLRPKATRRLRRWRGPSGTLHSTGR